MTTTTKRRKANSTPTPTITVYEVKAGQHTHQVQATNTQQLREQLARLVPSLPPYALQAASYLAATERASVQGQNWALRRVGMLQFVPDVPSDVPSKAAAPTPPTPRLDSQTQTAPADPNASAANDNDASESQEHQHGTY